MKTPKEKFYLYWWWCKTSTGPYIKCTYSGRLQTASRMQDYDRANGWKVGKMHKMQIEMEAPPK